MGETNKNRKKRKKSKYQLYSRIIGIVVTLLTIGGFVFETFQWENISILRLNEFIVFSSIVLIVLMSANIGICFFSSRLTLENKVLAGLGFSAMTLGIIGFKKVSFIYPISDVEIFYKAIQLFIGEFEINKSLKDIPLILNISKFQALFVVFGAIVVIMLREKLKHLRIRLFYKDVVIIGDTPDGSIIDLAKSIHSQGDKGRRVVIGYTKDCTLNKQLSQSDIPLISIDVEDEKAYGLKVCNVKRAKVIYLLCNDTEDNIKLAKTIYNKFYRKAKYSEDQRVQGENENTKEEQKSVKALIKEYFVLSSKEKPAADISSIDEKKKTICYIQYLKDDERDFYSLDSTFLNRDDSLDTYFLNKYDIAARQLIANMSINNVFNLKDKDTLDELKYKLDSMRIVVSGGGELLARTIVEIAKNCIYNNKTKLEIYYLNDETKKPNTLLESLPKEIFNIVKITNKTYKELEALEGSINLFFISSVNQREIINILQKSFQYDLHHSINEYLVLTEGSDVEYQVLMSYIDGLTAQFNHEDEDLVSNSAIHTIYLSRVTDLLMTVDDFYRYYGPKGEKSHDLYNNLREKNKVIEFNDLPDIFRESSMLSSLHNDFIIQTIDKLFPYKAYDIDLNKELINWEGVEEYFKYLSITEHERWYNERVLQGYIYHQERNNYYKKNENLKHWELLSNAQKDNHFRYVLKTIVEQKHNQINSEEWHNNLILKYQIDNN